MRVYELARELGVAANELMARARDLGIGVSTVLSGLDEDSAGMMRKAMDSDTQKTTERRKRILVADDADTITSLLLTALETGGYDVVVARNGVEAYETGKSEDVDLVILDHLMPGLLGIEIIEKWREEGIDVPVIMLSGVDDDKTVVDSFDVGALDFVRKPFRLPELMARVRHWLASS